MFILLILISICPGWSAATSFGGGLSLHHDILAFLLLGSDMIESMHLNQVVYCYFLLFKMTLYCGISFVSFLLYPVFDSNHFPHFLS